MLRSLGSHPSPLVSIITPTIPERISLLEECELSVQVQTCERWEHLVLVDDKHEGCSATMNKLAEQAKGAWLLPLADDDILLPGCIETLLDHAEDGDIIYSPPLVWGMPAEGYCGVPPAIPSFALIPTYLWNLLGGYDETLVREEDRSMWIRAMDAGYTFFRADEKPTWVYRFHMKPNGEPGNKTFRGGKA